MTTFFPRTNSHAGIAIGPILFIVAILAVLVAALSSGTGTFSSAATGDRVKADVKSQANLIRAKVQECYMATIGNATFDYPAGPTPSGVLVKNMICPGDPSGQQGLWTGKRPASLPATPRGFNDWVYFNYGAGRCIIITPTAVSTDITNALLAVQKQFGPTETYFNTSDSSLSIWLTPLDTTKKCGT